MLNLQEKVACLDDNDAGLALDPHNKYRTQVSHCICILYLCNL